MESNLTVELRHLQMQDYESLKGIMEAVYKGFKDPFWASKDIKKLIEVFPDGQLCVIVDGEMVAGALSIIVDYKKYGDNHTYDQITGGETFDTHDPHGDILYGIDVFVHPDHRGLRLGRRLYDARKELCESLNLRGIMAGGRIPNYGEYADEISPRQYINKVKRKEIHDPILNFQLSNDFHVRKILKDYLPDDKDSKTFATLLEWNNIYYQGEENILKTKRSYVRIGLVQWQMRLFPSFDAMVEQIEYFVDAVSDYQSDFILFPEFFNAPLMAKYKPYGRSRSNSAFSKVHRTYS